MPVNCYNQRIHNSFRGVINQQAINSARVEAMKRRPNQAKTTDKVKERIEYIEHNTHSSERNLSNLWHRRSSR